MSLRDNIEGVLITAHQTSAMGRVTSPGTVALLPDHDLETVAQAVQHLLYVVAVLEGVVKLLADRIDPPVSI
jgi:hypothetical protein